MSKSAKRLLLFITTAIFLVLIACHSNPKKITVEQVTELVQTYFIESYNLDVRVESVSYERVSQYNYLNNVKVSDGKLEYRLFLDRNNKPASDDVLAAQRISRINASSYDEILESLGLARLEKIFGLDSPEYNGIGFTLSGIEYGVALSVNMTDRDKRTRDGIYSLLDILREDGIDCLTISFSKPKPNNFSFYTDLDREKFNKEYDSFIERTQYSEISKFD